MLLFFLPTFKFGRVENMTAAVIRCVQHLCIIAPNQKPWKPILLCHAIIQMRNKLLIRHYDVTLYSTSNQSLDFLKKKLQKCVIEKTILTLFFFCELGKDHYYSRFRVEHFLPTWWKPTSGSLGTMTNKPILLLPLQLIQTHDNSFCLQSTYWAMKLQEFKSIRSPVQIQNHTV
jgi:hypothetical protein